ncbi:MAG: hypothetical protein ACI93P_000306 [bacterium]|jgi:hypothetical protein
MYVIKFEIEPKKRSETKLQFSSAYFQYNFIITPCLNGVGTDIGFFGKSFG